VASSSSSHPAWGQVGGRASERDVDVKCESVLLSAEVPLSKRRRIWLGPPLGVRVAPYLGKVSDSELVARASSLRVLRSSALAARSAARSFFLVHCLSHFLKVLKGL
jgi:hypothetical protein